MVDSLCTPNKFQYDDSRITHHASRITREVSFAFWLLPIQQKSLKIVVQ